MIEPNGAGYRPEIEDVPRELGYPDEWYEPLENKERPSDEELEEIIKQKTNDNDR
jgi:hypothetical protein